MYLRIGLLPSTGMLQDRLEAATFFLDISIYRKIQRVNTFK